MKNKKAFLSVSFQERNHLQPEFVVIKQVLGSFGIEAVDFVTKFTFTVGQEKEMMQQACQQIRIADLLIAEVSEKAIGVGIEVGYASAIGKPVLYIRKSTASYSTTVGGIATEALVYSNTEDLRTKLMHYLEKFMGKVETS